MEGGVRVRGLSEDARKAKARRELGFRRKKSIEPGRKEVVVGEAKEGFSGRIEEKDLGVLIDTNDRVRGGLNDALEAKLRLKESRLKTAFFPLTEDLFNKRRKTGIGRRVFGEDKRGVERGEKERRRLARKMEFGGRKEEQRDGFNGSLDEIKTKAVGGRND